MVDLGPYLGLVRPYAETHVIGFVFFPILAAVVITDLTGIGHERADALHRDRGSREVLIATRLPAVILLVAAPRIAPSATIHDSLVATVVGICLLVLGEALRVWSRATLGTYFTYSVQTSGDQPVITSGPYRFCRHPSYTGVLLIALGVSLGWDNWLGLGVFMLATCIGVGYRIHIEEQALLRDLGDRYVVYAGGRKRLIPFVW